MSKKKQFIIIFISFIIICIGTLIFLLYGPYKGFRDWLITSAMTTYNHQYLATTFYSKNIIDNVLENNKIVEPEDDTNTNLIDINTDNVNNIIYKDEYDKEILDRDINTPYKIIRIKEKGFEGFLAAVYDPSKISLAVSKDIFTKGEFLVDMSKRENAILAINGGGFSDVNGFGNGGFPRGIVISKGKIINATSTYSGLIGFTKDNKLFLGRLSAKEAIEKGIRDAVEFGPFLIVNGEVSSVVGNGGFGIHPRSVIGQRKDGIVLFLVIDGRRINSMGADMDDLIKIMKRYGAYNAANLDGGNSSVLVENHKILNRPINWGEEEATRPIPNGFIVTK